ncbi:ABC transporter permease [Acetobacterium woodii]|uniref:Antimicrobial peptide ABC transport system permease protein n=1 Tax=Acetobacterium woodii (strain ATCC 29683 / DSM 1030 / JCM 2381 / KCTC 1655 / WB1) TaxID=931626 RepID=H6LK73_ACEWD|nr:ABC transporter permease [Acetobacterium woodii]AFA49993.1 antimicrobial peptide ABC transport system permease protein [Acetobacterium woodii DSM 1030]
MKLLLDLVQKDFKRNPAITAALVIFLTMSVLLMAGGLRVVGTLLSAYNGLNEKAKPPQYLQMHKGVYDHNAIENFVAEQADIREFITVKMLTINNANIRYRDETLENVLMDNSFVVQNEGFDYLLNMDNEVASVNDGEIGVPVYYAETLGIKVGDVIILKAGDYTNTLKVSTLIRDAQMNVAMTSSKRFLISPADQAVLSQHMGEWEYEFEFLLSEGTSPAALEQAYMAADLPSNGVAITGSLLNLFNVFSYGLVAMIIMSISILLIVIAILCLSYVIQATMADEQTAIGEMKAMGFPGKIMVTLYQVKYLSLMAVAGVIGYLGAIPFGDYFSAAVVLYCGQGNRQELKWVLPLMGIVLLSGVVLWWCYRVIKKNLKKTVVELLKGAKQRSTEGHYTLPLSGLKHPNLTIAMGELACKGKQYLVIFLVFVFSSFLILLPMNMNHSIQDSSFITYMGVGEADLRIDIQYSEAVIQQQEKALQVLQNDPDVEALAVYKNGYVEVQNEQGRGQNIRVESGDEAVFPLKYLDGRAPMSKSEMALSDLNASALGKKVGDDISVVYGGETMNFTVVGVYQDLTYGGKTAKAMIDFRNEDVEVYIMYIRLADGVDITSKTDQLRAALTDIKITPIKSFINQTLGGIVDNLSRVEVATLVMALLLNGVVTLMFLKLVMAREQGAIAIKKALGFSNRDIRIQLGIRVLTIQGLAILLGTLLANTLGERIFGMMLSTMGASRITLLIQPVKAYLLCPGIQLMVVFITIIGATGAVKANHIRAQIME